MPPVLPDLPALLVRRVPRAPPGLLVLPDPLAQRVPPDLPALPGQPVLLDLLGLPVQLPRQYMHNKENAVTMRLSAHYRQLNNPYNYT